MSLGSPGCDTTTYREATERRIDYVVPVKGATGANPGEFGLMPSGRTG